MTLHETMGDETEEFYNNVLIAADMVEHLKDREVIYAAIRAARIATLSEQNPRKMFCRQRSKFPHIPLNMDFKNWND